MVKYHQKTDEVEHMDNNREKRFNDIINTGRRFMHGDRDNDPNAEGFVSDQDKGLPMPPLTKAAMAAETAKIILPQDFADLDLKCDFAKLLYDRRSSRVYTGEEMSLVQLSFLLWATQGVKGIRGKGYATLRTVPCGGARHEYETYLIVSKVEGLEPGIYHYLPMEHAIEYLGEVDDIPGTVSAMLCDQKWSGKANVVFFWAMIAYRAEWRYGIFAHRTALIDAGHIGQNLYLACTALNLGTCGVAAFSHDLCNRILGLDGEDEYVVYASPVGTVNHANDAAEERSTYSFVYDKDI